MAFSQITEMKIVQKYRIIHLPPIDKNFHPHLSQHEKLGNHFFSASEWSQLLSKKPWVLFQEALAA